MLYKHKRIIRKRVAFIANNGDWHVHAYIDGNHAKGKIVVNIWELTSTNTNLPMFYQISEKYYV